MKLFLQTAFVFVVVGLVLGCTVPGTQGGAYVGLGRGPGGGMTVGVQVAAPPAHYGQPYAPQQMAPVFVAPPSPPPVVYVVPPAHHGYRPNHGHQPSNAYPYAIPPQRSHVQRPSYGTAQPHYQGRRGW